MPVKLGRPLDPTVRKEERECPKHGTTRHGFHLTGEAGNRTWRCSECDVEKQRDYINRRDNGGEVRGYNKHEEPKFKFCPIHNLALPATGICDDC